MVLLFALKNRTLSSKRGMNAYYDAIDWLGGYPYESATREEIANCLDEFDLTYSNNDQPSFLFGLLGTGCAEYCFTRAFPRKSEPPAAPVPSTR
jgi:2-polyprenyl-6-hydroxyphenyl methylase/3-demethylubiquinone-9 3-methyltransferase